MLRNVSGVVDESRIDGGAVVRQFCMQTELTIGKAKILLLLAIEISLGLDMSERKLLASKLLRAILDAGCFFQREDWVDLDHIWQEPRILDSFTDALVEYLSCYKGKTQFNKVVVGDKVYGPFGVLPIFAVCSVKAGIPFVIWKEWARPATGNSLIFGPVLEGDKLLILHDVISHGATPIKIVADLRRFIQDKKGCEIVGILSILDCERGGMIFIKQKTKVLVEAIISRSELREAISKLEG